MHLIQQCVSKRSFFYHRSSVYIINWYVLVIVNIQYIHDLPTTRLTYSVQSFSLTLDIFSALLVAHVSVNTSLRVTCVHCATTFNELPPYTCS